MSSTMILVLTIVQLALSLFLIITVLFQQGKRQGLSGAISGAADTFLSKNKAKSWDVRLAKLTTWVAAAFIILTLALNLIPVREASTATPDTQSPVTVENADVTPAADGTATPDATDAAAPAADAQTPDAAPAADAQTPAA